MTSYDKPHLSYSAQVQRLVERGLHVGDRAGAERLLASIGYYHLSAYMYPYRELLPPAEQCRQSPVHYRSDAFQPGAAFEQVIGLYEFDRLLRLYCLEALGHVEIGLRTRATYILGERDTFGHLEQSALDGKSCHRVGRDGRTDFDAWQDRCRRLQSDARNEDFIRHALHKYGEPLPVWTAVETFDFGALARLLGLMRGDDLNCLAGDLGIKHARLLVDVVRGLNVVRNIASHHGRLWNRQIVYGLRNYDPRGVAPELRHVARGGERKKIYIYLVWMTYLAHQFAPDSSAKESLLGLVDVLGSTTTRSLVDDMGFPADWRRQQVWKG